MPGSVASTTESPSAGRGRRRAVALAVALLAVSAAVAWGVWGAWRGPGAQGEGAPAGARQGGEVPKASGTPGAAQGPANGAAQAPDPGGEVLRPDAGQAPAGGAEEWPGQSRGFVGPNGEGSHTPDEWPTLEEYNRAWAELGASENELPSVVEGDYVRGVLMICFDRGIGELAAHEIVWARGGVWGYDFFWLRDDGPAYAVCYFPDASDQEALEALAAELRACPGVVSVDLDGMCYLEEDESAELAYLPQQYYLRTSRFIGAWNTVKCNGRATIAVLDSGCDIGHPDLVGNLLPGIDVTKGKDSPPAPSFSDKDGHGTKVAGVASAVAGDFTGIDGASYNAKVLPIRIKDDVGNIKWDYICSALRYIDNHQQQVQVVNMSFSSPNSSVEAQRLVSDLRAKGTVLVAAAGNQYMSGGPLHIYRYPACFDDVISVGSIDASDTIAPDSNHNPRVDLCAPGVGVYTTSSPLATGVQYAMVSGTSFATPQVSAAAALLKVEHPSWGPDLIERALEATARDLGNVGRDDTYGHGALNAEAAVAWLPPADSSIPELWLDRGDVELGPDGAHGYDSSGSELRSASQSVIVRQADGPATAHSIRVVSEGAWDVTLDGVRFDGDRPLLDLSPSASVRVRLRGSSEAIGRSATAATVRVPQGASAVFQSFSEGSLRAESAGRGAVVGGSAQEASGSITFVSGTVEAVARGGGLNMAAAIGGGSDQTNGPIVIDGGTVKASIEEGITITSARGCCSAGRSKGPAPITIRGGKVEARGNWSSSGIGGHNYGGFGEGSSVEVSGGEVTATGGFQADGIAAESVSFSGDAKVSVTGTRYAAGVAAKELRVSGGSVDVMAGGLLSAGVDADKTQVTGGTLVVRPLDGQTNMGLHGALDVSGGRVSVKAQVPGSSGWPGCAAPAIWGGPVSVRGGTVDAYGGHGAAGIGGGWSGGLADTAGVAVTITGGAVNAVPGEPCKDGIGNGVGATADPIWPTDGTERVWPCAIEHVGDLSTLSVDGRSAADLHIFERNEDGGIHLYLRAGTHTLSCDGATKTVQLGP